MFNTVKFSDFDPVLYSAFFSWLTFLSTLPYIAALWDFVKSRQSREEILRSFRQANQAEMAAFIFFVILWLIILAGMRWAWKKPAFLCIEKNGEWVIRNSFYLANCRIPPEQPRQIEWVFSKSYDDNGPDYSFSGYFLILRDNAPPISMQHSSQPMKDGTPDFFQQLGYPDGINMLTGLNGGQLTPRLTWNSSGPIILAEKE
ncbi:MAG: hypothetical protein KKB51_17465 [Candidatus Riflebacteria bacterium]|nr:hypothetical protein [Candidatus Riflebacteria bacterium]